MHEQVTMSLEDHPRRRDIETVRQRLSEFNRTFAPADEHRRLCGFLRDLSGDIVGGLVGGTYWRWLYVEALWVSSSYRGRGYGRELLRAAEEEAVRRGCRYVHLDTHSFQAVGFYERMGYQHAGELRDLPEGYSRYLMWKQLGAGGL